MNSCEMTPDDGHRLCKNNWFIGISSDFPRTIFLHEQNRLLSRTWVGKNSFSLSLSKQNHFPDIAWGVCYFAFGLAFKNYQTVNCLKSFFGCWKGLKQHVSYSQTVDEKLCTS